MTTYRISGNSDARTSKLHGSVYETREDALAALGRVLTAVVEVRVDAEVGSSWLVYADEAVAAADEDGHLAVASVETM